jgi:hypothetical protein
MVSATQAFTIFLFLFCVLLYRLPSTAVYPPAGGWFQPLRPSPLFYSCSVSCRTGYPVPQFIHSKHPFKKERKYKGRTGTIAKSIGIKFDIYDLLSTPGSSFSCDSVEGSCLSMRLKFSEEYRNRFKVESFC